MKKKIYFCVDGISFLRCNHKLFPNGNGCYSYERTEYHIKNGSDSIITYSLAHLSFDLIEKGYDIYLCYRDNVVKIEPHMNLSGIGEAGKDLRPTHNLFKLFRAGVFNKLIGFKKEE